MTDKREGHISESSVYRILKSNGLVTSQPLIPWPPYRSIGTRPKKGMPDVADGLHLSEDRGIWQVLSLDHPGRLYNHYIVRWELCPSMNAVDIVTAGGAQGKIGRVRGLLQQQEIPRIIGQPDPCNRIFWIGQKRYWKP